MSRFFYGDYIHEQDEVYPYMIRFETVNNDRNIPWYVNATMIVKGSLCGCGTQADLNNKIEELNRAYDFHYKDAGFLLDDDTISQHYFRSDDTYNLTGNRVAYRSWDSVEPTELYNTRSYTIAIEAKFETSYNSLLDLQETITTRGSIDPCTRRFPTWNGTLLKQQLYGGGPLVMEQSGYMISKDIAGFAIPAPWFPNHEDKDRRIITSSSGKSWGSAHGSPSYGYRAQWRYVMELPINVRQEPNNMGSSSLGSYGSGSTIWTYNGPSSPLPVDDAADPAGV